MTDELVVARMVRAWSARVLPDEPEAVDRAVAAAVRSYAGGASVGEAFGVARRFLWAWTHHPSHRRVAAAGLRAAS